MTTRTTISQKNQSIFIQISRWIVSLIRRFFWAILIIFFLMIIAGAIMTTLEHSEIEEVRPYIKKYSTMDTDEVIDLVAIALESTSIAVRNWANVFVVVSLPSSYIVFGGVQVVYTEMEPSIINAWNSLTNLHWTTKLGIVLFQIVVVLIWLLQRTIRKRQYVARIQRYIGGKVQYIRDLYNRFVSRIRKTSSFLADTLPHVIFWAGTAMWVALAPEVLERYAMGRPSTYVLYAVPLIFSSRAIIVYEASNHGRVVVLEKRLGTQKSQLGDITPRAQPETPVSKISQYISSWTTPLKSTASTPLAGMKTPSETPRGIQAIALLEEHIDTWVDQYDDIKSILFWVQYWSVIGMVLLLEGLPITGHVFELVWFWPMMRFICSIWLQLPGTAGACLCFSYIIKPLADYYGTHVSTPEITTAQSNIILNALATVGFISMERKEMLSNMLASGGTLILAAIPILFLPSTFVRIGIFVFGYARPIVSSVRTLVCVQNAHDKIVGMTQDRKGSHSKKKESQEISKTMSISRASLLSLQWLEYWVVFSVFLQVCEHMGSILRWIPLSSQIQLCTILWLQLPYFQGAQLWFARVSRVYYRIRSIVIWDSTSMVATTSTPRAIQQPQMLQSNESNKKATGSVIKNRRQDRIEEAEEQEEEMIDSAQVHDERDDNSANTESDHVVVEEQVDADEKETKGELVETVESEKTENVNGDDETENADVDKKSKVASTKVKRRSQRKLK